MTIYNVIVVSAELPASAALISTLSDYVFKAPEQVAAGKSGESYAVNFGRTAIDPETFLYLAGVPIGEHFSFLWERLADGLLGFIVVFDAESRSGLDETKGLVAQLKELTDSPFIMALNGLTDRKSPEAVELKKTLGIAREEQIVCCDINEKSSAKEALLKLLSIGTRMAKKVGA